MDSRRLTRNVGWLWVGYGGRSLGYFLLIVVLTRELGTAGFGELSLFLALTLGVSLVAGSWPFLAVPVLSAEEGSIGAAFRPSLYVAAMATAASLVVAIPVAFALGIDAPASIACVVVSSVALVGLQGIFSVQQTEGRMGEIALLQTLERVVALAVALVAVAATDLGVVGAEVLLTGAAAVTFTVAIVVVHRRQELFRAPSDAMPYHLISTVMGAVGAMGIVSLASYGVAYADTFTLAIFRSHSEVGIYSLAYSIFTFVTALTAYWLTAALPEHARSSAAGRNLKEQLPLPRLLKYTGLWGTLIGITGVAAAFVLPLVFGSEFEEAAVPLLILLGGSGVFAATYYAFLAALVGSKRSSLVAKVGIASVAVNIALDLILVPPFGVVGPAFATFGQSLVGTFALALIVLGRGASLRLAAVAAPVVTATMLLALDPTSIPLASLTVVVALLTGLWALTSGDRPDLRAWGRSSS
ncbi:MAG: oligosaccharide flippase family protein [Actinobacteria bacterium]|nr:oligosaccharide flippase family protein [Actinomycetota bacterium]